MTPGPGWATFRLKLLALVTVPVLILLVGMLLRPGNDPAVERERLAARVETTLDRLLEQAATVADVALSDGPEAARASLGTSRLARRLEGVGTLDAGLVYLDWVGMPSDPPPGFARRTGSRWSLRLDGVRTRLIARSGPDESGHYALAAFVLDTTLDDLRFSSLIGATGHSILEVAFRDTGEPRNPPPEGDEASLELQTPDGRILGTAEIISADRSWVESRQRRQTHAWATLAFCLLAACLFNWRSWSTTPAGLSATIAAIAVGRIALAWLAVPARLLPRDLGGPGLYGTSRPWDLLASPADFLLTSVAIYLICVAARVGCASLMRDRRSLAIGAAAAIAMTASAAAFGLTVSLGRNSTASLTGTPLPFVADGRLVLWIGLLLVLLGCAELWALVAAATRLGRIPRRRGAGAIPVGLAFVPLVVIAGLTLQQIGSTLAMERLTSEIAPQLVDQNERRETALTLALREIREGFVRHGGFDPSARDRLETLAYRYWVGGELFYKRLESSIDVYDSHGNLLSHFGFGVAPIDEPIDTIQRPVRRLSFKNDQLAISGIRESLLHGEAPLFGDAEFFGVVVGHVLDEPENLPFLARSEPYLAALGPGIDTRSKRWISSVQYVLYEASGAIRYTTLRSPPARNETIREAALDGRVFDVATGDVSYRGLAVEEADGRLHLLLLPRPRAVERLASAARAALLGAVVLLIITVAARLIRGVPAGGPTELVRGSFYKKILAAFLLASVPTLIALALLLRGYVERRADAALIASVGRTVGAVQRVIEDYSKAPADEADAPAPILDHAILHWLAHVVGEEIHAYEGGVLRASSRPELFASGLLPARLDGDVRRKMLQEGLPFLVQPVSLGSTQVPFVYAPIPDAAGSDRIVAIPMGVEQQERERDVARVGEMILLATVILVGLLAFAAAILARTLARPVRELLDATDRITEGDYATRLDPTTHDEVAELVNGFNTMAGALSRQRLDLENRRDYIETLLRHATTGVVSLDPDGRIVTLNPAAIELLDTCSERLVAGGSLLDALAGCNELAALGRAVEAAATSPGDPLDVDLTRDGEPRRYRLVRVALERGDAGSFGTLLLLDDVTELMRSNQLAAWAEMARSIAHEIKNPLTPIQLSTEHLRRLFRDRGVTLTREEDSCLETIIKQVRALYDIAGEFSTYAKLPVLAPEPTDPVAFMRTAIGPYRAAHPPGVSIDERYETAPRIAADPKVLARAVINLVENALQAMPDGGVLTAGVRRAVDDVVELYVSDTGHGLEPDVQRRLFEPYFSTKSSGTGLGLAIVRRAVEAHRGTIDVDSAPGGGTTFRIRIPAERPD